MKKTVSLSVCYLLLSSMIHAQDSSMAISKNKYIQVDLGIGYLHTNMGSINTSLKNFGYQPIKDNYTTLSFTSAYFVNRFLFRTEVSVVLPNHVEQPDNIKTSFSGYAISAGIGYAVIQNRHFRLYPYVGINSFSTNLKFTDLSSVDNMNELLNSPLRNAKIHFSNASLDIGAQLERIITLKNNKWDCPQNNKYMTVGTRLGYNWSPGTVKASYNGNQLNGAPKYNFQGPYIKLVVGMGTKIRELKWK
jgi:hypothetical protein